jgi:predicted enzyme related to lactoylglutathione lyase
MHAANLEYLRKQAKALLRAYERGDPQAIARFQAAYPHLRTPSVLVGASAKALTLADAQFTLARELGHASWRRLKLHVEDAARQSAATSSSSSPPQSQNKEMPTMTSKVTIENTIPVLPVSDIAATLEFYLQKVGFKHEWGCEKRPDGSMAKLGAVSRDGHQIMLRQPPGPIARFEIWIGCSSVEQLYAELKAAGVTIVQPPTNQHWAVEMRVSDPDGHILQFGSEPRTDVPFGQRIEL